MDSLFSQLQSESSDYTAPLLRALLHDRGLTCLQLQKQLGGCVGLMRNSHPIPHVLFCLGMEATSFYMGTSQRSPEEQKH